MARSRATPAYSRSGFFPPATNDGSVTAGTRRGEYLAVDPMPCAERSASPIGITSGNQHWLAQWVQPRRGQSAWRRCGRISRSTRCRRRAWRASGDVLPVAATGVGGELVDAGQVVAELGARECVDGDAEAGGLGHVVLVPIPVAAARRGDLSGHGVVPQAALAARMAFLTPGTSMPLSKTCSTFSDGDSSAAVITAGPQRGSWAHCVGQLAGCGAAPAC